MSHLMSTSNEHFPSNEVEHAYITSNIIAIASPDSQSHSLVISFLESLYRGRCKLYVLCSEIEEAFQKETDEIKITMYPIDDFNPCALRLIDIFCNDVDEFLSESENNIVAVMCNAGRGRTGLMVTSYLMYSGLFQTAELARRHFDTARLHNAISTPSQIRYLYYFENMLRSNSFQTYTYRITHIRIHTVPNFDPAISGGGCDPYVVVKTLTRVTHTKWKPKLVFNQLKEKAPIRKYNAVDDEINIDLSPYFVEVRNDVSITIFDKDDDESEKMCKVWFHTAFIDSNYLVFEKEFTDKAVFDKKHRLFSKDFRIELFLHRVFSEDVVMEEMPLKTEDEIEEEIRRSYGIASGAMDLLDDQDFTRMAEGDDYKDGSSNNSHASISGETNSDSSYEGAINYSSL